MLCKSAPQIIAYQSKPYHQACQLRYELFFAEHNLPWSVLGILQEFEHDHVVTVRDNSVVAYGQLALIAGDKYQIRQMVVHPNYRSQNLGRNTMLFLQNLARQRKAIALVLKARVTAVDFYRKFGFRACGEAFPSTTTGVTHVPMKSLWFGSCLTRSNRNCLN